MAGSQLKQLKAALKDKGLIGQTNVSQKKLKKKNSQSSTNNNTKNINRDEKLQQLKEIRDQFNKFDQKLIDPNMTFLLFIKVNLLKLDQNSIILWL